MIDLPDDDFAPEDLPVSDSPSDSEQQPFDAPNGLEDADDRDQENAGGESGGDNTGLAPYVLDLLNRMQDIERKLVDLWPIREVEGTASDGMTVEFVLVTSASASSDGTATVKCAITYGFSTADGIAHTTVANSGQRPYGKLLKATFGWWVTALDGTSLFYAGDEVPDTAACT